MGTFFNLKVFYPIKNHGGHNQMQKVGFSLYLSSAVQKIKFEIKFAHI